MAQRLSNVHEAMGLALSTKEEKKCDVQGQQSGSAGKSAHEILTAESEPWCAQWKEGTGSQKMYSDLPMNTVACRPSH